MKICCFQLLSNLAVVIIEYKLPTTLYVRVSA